MHERLPWLPLAQLNATTAPGPGGTAPPPPVATGPEMGAAGATVTSAPGTVPASGPAPDPKKDAGPFGGMMGLLPIILMFVALYFFLIRGNKKEEKRRKSLIADLKKGDRVMTIGGLVARVVSIEGDEVVLKIDESQNVKATYRKSAIQEVLGVDDKK